MTEAENANIEEMNNGGLTPSAGAPTPAVDTPVTEQSDVAEATEVTPVTDTHSEVINAAPSFLRDEDDLRVDDNFNLTYVLKNGKTLKISVIKPNLGVSTQLGDAQLKFNESDSGERYMQINNVGVYQMIMNSIIKAVLVDGKPLHTVTFESLSKVGFTKGELDDVMNIITTFYLSE